MKDRRDFQPDVKPAGEGRLAHMFSLSAQDYLAMAQRHRRLMAMCFFGIMAVAVLATVAIPAKYKSEVRFLLQRDRVDPVSTASASAPVMFKDTITEEEINSETELMLSDDVLAKVVTENGLQNHKSLTAMLTGTPSEQERIAKAVKHLRADLTVSAIKKTNLFSVGYSSRDPQEAQKVLVSLKQAYLDKHIAVHRPQGESAFFKQQADQYKAQLEELEKKQKEFSASVNGVSPIMARDLTLQKMSDFQSTLETTRAQIKEAQQRIADLDKQSASTPTRITTAEKKGQNAVLLEQLKSTLLALELKRTELLTKYQPDYRPVKEVEQQIAATRDKIEQEEKARVQEVTTDQSPTFAWIDSERAKTKADLEGLKARQAALQQVVGKYTADTRVLDAKGIDQQDLARQVKETEDNYLLYQHKFEESRIGDAMDQTKLLNVIVANEPGLPMLPVIPPYLILFVGFVLAVAMALAAGLTAEYFDPSFQTPAQVAAELSVPVLAAMPMRTDFDSVERKRTASIR